MAKNQERVSEPFLKRPKFTPSATKLKSENGVSHESTTVTMEGTATKQPAQSRLKTKVSNVIKDFKKRHLLWVKAVFFLQSASLVVLYPYLTIHMRSLGFTVQDASLINTAIPAADVVGPPLAGLVADKLGNFRVFMASVTFLNGAAALALLLIPSTIVQPFKLCCTQTDGCAPVLNHQKIGISNKTFLFKIRPFFIEVLY